MTIKRQTALYAAPLWLKMMFVLAQKYYFCLCLFLASFVLAGHAADFDAEPAEAASTLRTWHTTDGLPSDSVTAIIQTRDGFLWIGTTVGLVRFDGVKFTEVPSENSISNCAIGITALCEDSEGHLWIGTQQNGLFELNRGRMFHYSKAEGLPSDNIACLGADNQGQVWIGGNAGLCLWNGYNFQKFTKRDGLPDESVSGVSVARSGAVWITTRVGLCRFVNDRIEPYVFQTDSQGRSPEYLGAYEDRRGNLWAFGDTYLINLAEGKRFNYFRSSEPASVRIWSLCEGRDGRLWIGTSGRGLFCFEDNRFQPVMLGQNRWPYDVRAICEDHEGNLWLGTSGGGLVQMRMQSVQVVRGGQGLPDSSPTALALDTDGRIYVGLQRGGLWMGESGRFDQIGGGFGLALQYSVSSVTLAADGTLWAGTIGGGLYGLRGGRGVHLTSADGLANNSIAALCVDQETNLWISTTAGSLNRFDASGLKRFGVKDGLPSSPVTAMIPAADGGLWLGTSDGKILRETNGTFSVAAVASSWTVSPVLSLYEDEQLWIGTAGAGLFCLTNGVLENWNTNSGLPSGTIAGVVEDGAQNLWLATDAGIFRISAGDIRRVLPKPNNPLPCKMVSAAKVAVEPAAACADRIARGPDGHLWFATSEGVLNVDSRQAENGPATLPVYLENVSINAGAPLPLLAGELWAPRTNTSSFELPVDLRSLEFHFTALELSAPEDVRFRHRLDGYDSDWVDDGDTRSFRYGKITHGKYQFRVAARIADGSWQEAKNVFVFTVPTPFYAQPWAIALYIFSAVGLVTVTVRLISHRRLRSRLARLEQQQALERERMRIARDMHDEMGSKLTKISFLSEHLQMDADAGGVSKDKVHSIAQASQDLLKTMDEIVWVVNPRNDTLENLTAYLSHHAVEYFQNTTIECDLNLAPEMPNYPLSSEARHNLFLTFEEALNNVLKHSAATQVNVTMAIVNGNFELQIADNGKGFDPRSSDTQMRAVRGGNGLKNMRQRLAGLGGECVVASRPGGGTTVTIRVPLSNQPLD